ncbi:MAG TPA: enoyl-CoA hydratase-related protein [Solirubrobacteraceae bacterium]|jgi:2-(1,2-epoxy-1,2-dihydrophenyl)acetyl-CoA isomerase|nr:enoyl-CoA hydratase-related protein [Solirubrobacteraceae bacterium]
MTDELEVIEHGEGVLELRLNRPDRLNAWTPTLSVATVAALEAAERDDAVRAVIFTGAGRGFCAGVDMAVGFETHPDGGANLRMTHRRWYAPPVLSLRALPKPVIAAVNGPAVGYGTSLALACDFTLMARSAYLMLGFARIGVALDGGASLFVYSRIGRGRATEMAMLADPIPAEAALEWGLVNRVIDDEQLHEEALALARRLAAGPTQAYAGIKAEFNHLELPGLAEQLEFEGEVQERMARSADFTEGVSAFLAKRPARFTGR